MAAAICVRPIFPVLKFLEQNLKQEANDRPEAPPADVFLQRGPAEASNRLTRISKLPIGVHVPSLPGHEP
eukprot:1101682-Pelagomonas_calceolata.AAC.1